MRAAQRIALLVVAFASHAAVAQLFPWRINSGSNTPIVDSKGLAWDADVHFTSGFYDTVTNRCGTGPIGCYCKMRTYNAKTQKAPYGYAIPLPNSMYTVKLHFIEPFWTAAGNRVMDVVVEGTTVFPRFDIFKEAKGKNVPYSFEVNTTVTDGWLNIQLVAVLLNPLITGVEIFAPPIPDRRINCGGGIYTDPRGKVWEADKYAVKGNIYAVTGDIAGTKKDALYNSERYFNDAALFFYQIPVLHSGDVYVTLHFAEIFHTSIGFRLFDVWVEGRLVQAALDIYKEVGYKTAYTLSVEARVTDGFVSIELVKITDNPKINAIEIIDMVNYQPPTMAPSISFAPSQSPTASAAPTVSAAPTLSPTTSAAPSSTPVFHPILVNCGGGNYIDNAGQQTWKADHGFVGGGVYANGGINILDTLDDPLYQVERNGAFKYSFPVPVASYEVVLHFAELYWKLPKERTFDVIIESTTLKNVDIVQQGGGPNKAFTLKSAQIVVDGFLNIEFKPSVPAVDQPKLSAIEINLLGPHLAHAVSNGPYYAVDATNSGTAMINVNGNPSHTHGTGMHVVGWTWKEGATTLAQNASASIPMTVGNHNIAVTIVDSGGNVGTDATTATVFPFGYPVVTALSQTSGSITGGYPLTITGVGFAYTAIQIKVHFGLTVLTGPLIQIVNANTINIMVPQTAIAAPVTVAVETPFGKSIAETFTYVAAVPIAFTSALLSAFDSPTVAEFGPDGLLYVGTINGKLGKLTLNADHTAVVNTVISTIAANRAILGIAFDPMSNADPPSPYISTNYFFHGEWKSTFGNAINGDIRRISGANLDSQQMIITGLPVSDHDHGVNGITFGDNGELYIQIGSNTNGGVPGALTGKQLQKENYYSAATIVAQLADPLFQGTITYSAQDDGTPTGGRGIQVFANGIRNPFGIVFHSSGNIYGTDNGPNNGYGAMQMGCGAGQQIADKTEPDRVDRLVKGKYYGHPNSKRASVDNDVRQCTWRSHYEPTDAGFEAPLISMPSSTDGIIEWQTNHFFGQLRGNLITSKYTQGLSRIILTPDGTAVIPESVPALPLVGEGGLDVAQAPSGTLIEARLGNNALFYHKPTQPAMTELYVNAVFPTRGGQAGGNILKIYGVNFDKGIPTVTVGGKSCPITATVTPTLIQCTLPGGLGRVDVIVSTATETSAFTKGYRYITGLPKP